MNELRKECPICKHVWVVKYDWKLLGEVFLRADFAIAMFDHLQSHTSGAEIRVKNYEYNQGVNEKAVLVETQTENQ
jgi:hypothetical protein